jgi:hypothetical protein
MELNLYFYQIYLNYYTFLKVQTLFELFKLIRKEKEIGYNVNGLSP